MATDAYTLEAAETDIATLRGQVDRLSEVLTKLDSTDPPNTPAAGLIHYSIGGQHKYASSDGGYYNTGRATVYSTADQVVSSNTDVTLTSLTAVVAAGAYRITGMIVATQGSGAGGNVTQAVGFTGPATSHVRIGAEWFSSPGGGAYATGANVLGSLSGSVSTPAFSVGVQNYWDFRGLVVFTAGGTLRVVGQCNGANTWTANSYSLMDVTPVT